MKPFLDGATFTGCLVAAIYFLRFWRETGDRLFVFFAIAFGMLALNRASLALGHPTAEAAPYFYLVRLAAFLLIAFAVIDKNRRA